MAHPTMCMQPRDRRVRRAHQLCAAPRRTNRDTLTIARCAWRTLRCACNHATVGCAARTGFAQRRARTNRDTLTIAWCAWRTLRCACNQRPVGCAARTGFAQRRARTNRDTLTIAWCAWRTLRCACNHATRRVRRAHRLCATPCRMNRHHHRSVAWRSLRQRQMHP
jgi:hypothetical protein